MDFPVARLSLLLPQVSRDRALNDASLVLGCWPRNHFSLHKEADTSEQGCESNATAGQQQPLPPPLLKG